MTQTAHSLIGPRTREAFTHATVTNRQAVKEATKVHAREVCAVVWPGGTVDPDAIAWEWNNRFRSTAGRYSGIRHTTGNRDTPTIELAHGYLATHGVLEYLKVVRHELIHAWQDLHPDGGKPGHGPKFHQWVADMETHRHCKWW